MPTRKLEATAVVSSNSQYIKWVDREVYTNNCVRKYYIVGNPVHDCDGDEMPDGWELANRLEPKKKDAEGDVDKDGISNYREMNGQSMRVNVSISYIDLWDDAWNLLLNGAVVASCNGSTIGVAVVDGVLSKRAREHQRVFYNEHLTKFVLLNSLRRYSASL